MKFLNYTLSLLFIGLVLACNHTPSSSPQENLDGTITIQGRVLVDKTNKPSRSIIRINITNRWKVTNGDSTAQGENEGVYVNSQGYYRITIQKGDTISLNTNSLIYKDRIPNYTLTKLDKNQIINFTLYSDSTNYIKGLKKFPDQKNHVDRLLNYQNPEKLVTISGIVKNKKTREPLIGLPIGLSYVQNSQGLGHYQNTDKYGQFTMTVPQNSIVDFNALSKYRSAFITVTKDTIVFLNL